MFLNKSSMYTSLHCAKVVDIRILKWPTLTNNFSVVFHPGCPKFCAELCKLPKKIEKEKKENFEKKKEAKNAKNMKGLFAKKVHKANIVAFIKTN